MSICSEHQQKQDLAAMLDAAEARIAELERALREAKSLLTQAANRAQIDADAYQAAAAAAYRVLDPQTNN